MNSHGSAPGGPPPVAAPLHPPLPLLLLFLHTPRSRPVLRNGRRRKRRRRWLWKKQQRFLGVPDAASSEVKPGLRTPPDPGLNSEQRRWLLKGRREVFLLPSPGGAPTSRAPPFTHPSLPIPVSSSSSQPGFSLLPVFSCRAPTAPSGVSILSTSLFARGQPGWGREPRSGGDRGCPRAKSEVSPPSVPLVGRHLAAPGALHPARYRRRLLPGRWDPTGRTGLGSDGAEGFHSPPRPRDGC